MSRDPKTRKLQPLIAFASQIPGSAEKCWPGLLRFLSPWGSLSFIPHAHLLRQLAVGKATAEKGRDRLPNVPRSSHMNHSFVPSYAAKMVSRRNRTTPDPCWHEGENFYMQMASLVF